jgi:hypothetical protein
MLRYWDGADWTGYRAPTTGQGSVGPEFAGERPARAETKWAWLLAVTPAIFLLMNAVAALLGGAAGAQAPLSGAAIGLVVGLVLQDSKALAKAGVRVSKWWGVLLLPVYLVLRTVRARSSIGIPLVWFALMVGYVAGSGALLYAVESGTASTSAPGAALSAGEPQPGPTTAPAKPVPSGAATPTPAPFTPTASVEQLGGADVDIECWATGAYGDDYFYYGRFFTDAWHVRSADCSPTTSSGRPGKKERRALKTAYPGTPVDAANLAMLYRICAENDRGWADELAGGRGTLGLARLVEGALVICPDHPQRAKAERLIAETRQGGSTA